MGNQSVYKESRKVSETEKIDGDTKQLGKNNTEEQISTSEKCHSEQYQKENKEKTLCVPICKLESFKDFKFPNNMELCIKKLFENYCPQASTRTSSTSSHSQISYYQENTPHRKMSNEDVHFPTSGLNNSSSECSYDAEDSINLSFTLNTRPFLFEEDENKEASQERNLEDINSKHSSFGSNNSNNYTNSIRNSYMIKLALNQCLQSKKSDNSRLYNNVIILDWDDTLLPSTFLYPLITGKYNELDEPNKKLLSCLEKTVCKLLKFCVANGDTYIVTNASQGWVEMSSKIFIPQVLEILPKIDIQSARENYEKQFPGDNRQWKINTFIDVQKKYNKEKILNLICLGDSINELEAAFNLRSNYREAFIKTIKMQDKPNIAELAKELKLILKSTDQIFFTAKNLKIDVDKKKK